MAPAHKHRFTQRDCQHAAVPAQQRALPSERGSGTVAAMPMGRTKSRHLIPTVSCSDRCATQSCRSKIPLLRPSTDRPRMSVGLAGRAEQSGVCAPQIMRGLRPDLPMTVLSSTAELPVPSMVVVFSFSIRTFAATRLPYRRMTGRQTALICNREPVRLTHPGRDACGEDPGAVDDQGGEGATASAGVTPGGEGAEAAAENPMLVDWVRQRATQARRVASVCTGAFLLAAAFCACSP
jgi:hypothetical protein